MKNGIELVRTSSTVGDKFWSEGYFYRTVGVVTADAVKYYVEHGQQKHWQAVDYAYYKHKQQMLLSQFS